MLLFNSELQLVYGNPMSDFPHILAAIQELKNHSSQNSHVIQTIQPSKPTNIPTLTLENLPAPGHLGHLPDFYLIIKIIYVKEWIDNHNKRVKHILAWDGTGEVTDTDSALTELLTVQSIDYPVSGIIRRLSIWESVFSRYPKDAVVGNWLRLSGLYVAAARQGAPFGDVASRDNFFTAEILSDNDPIVMSRIAESTTRIASVQRLPPSHLAPNTAYRKAPATITVNSAHTANPFPSHAYNEAISSGSRYSHLSSYTGNSHTSFFNDSLSMHPFAQNQGHGHSHLSHFASIPSLSSHTPQNAGNKRRPSIEYASEPPAAKRHAPLPNHSSSADQFSDATATMDGDELLPVDPLHKTTSAKIKLLASKFTAPIMYASRALSKLPKSSEVSELYRVRGFLKYVWPLPSKSQASDYLRKSCSVCHTVQQEGQLPSHIANCHGTQYTDIIYFVLKVGDKADDIFIQVVGSAAELFLGRSAKLSKSDPAALLKLMKALEREIGQVADFFVVANPPLRDLESPSFLLFGTKFNSV